MWSLSRAKGETTMWKSALVFVFGAAMVGAQTPTATPSGKDLYMKFNCYACHGFSGQNGSGARLVPMKMSQETFMDFVRKGRGQMPHYTVKVLPDAQLAAVYAYIKTLPDLTPAAKSIPVLSEILSQN
jgi:ubiquinol-cytochrome c reductase cytochrome c subunit